MKTLNQRFPDVAKNLEILADECAGIIQVKSKAVRFEIDDRHPGYPSPREGLNFECGNLLAAIDILVANGVLKPGGKSGTTCQAILSAFVADHSPTDNCLSVRLESIRGGAPRRRRRDRRPASAATSPRFRRRVHILRGSASRIVRTVFRALPPPPASLPPTPAAAPASPAAAR